MARHVLRMRGRPQSGFANQRVVSNRDAAVLPSATGREEGRTEDEALSDFESEVQDHEAGAKPMSEVTGGPQGGTPEEDTSGLNDVQRALRDAAEAPVARREVGE